MNDFCWICEQGWVASNDPIATHQRTGEWAHVRCCKRTFAGSMWAFKAAFYDLWLTIKGRFS